jgi:hypothetical protein
MAELERGLGKSEEIKINERFYRKEEILKLTGKYDLEAAHYDNSYELSDRLDLDKTEKIYARLLIAGKLLRQNLQERSTFEEPRPFQRYEWYRIHVDPRLEELEFIEKSNKIAIEKIKETISSNRATKIGEAMQNILSLGFYQGHQEDDAFILTEQNLDNWEQEWSQKIPPREN